MCRRLRLKAGAGAYLYRQGFVETDTYFLEGGAHYPLGRRYYISGDARQYVGGNLDSFQFLAEVGVTL